MPHPLGSFCVRKLQNVQTEAQYMAAVLRLLPEHAMLEAHFKGAK